MFTRRSDFSVISTEVLGGKEWLLARQTGITGFTEVLVVTKCGCGEELGGWVTVFTSSLVLDCGKCKTEIWVPDTVLRMAVGKEDELMLEAAKIRAAHGGSGLWIPDC